MGFWLQTSVLSLLLVKSCVSAVAADWEETITTGAPGSFPQPRPLSATYFFGWAGFTAATAEARFTRIPGNQIELDGVGRTVGLVRTLWRMDVKHRAVADATDLRPIEVEQVENVRSKTLTTKLAFNHAGVTRTRWDGKEGADNAKTRQFNFPNLLDLHSSLLYLRSQPLRDRSVQRIVVYPASSAYVATVTVLGREKISIRAGTFSAIKLDLQLSKIGKDNQLEPHHKFRRAIIWVSDDPDRLLLRIEAQIFVGTVFAELQSVRFEKNDKRQGPS